MDRKHKLEFSPVNAELIKELEFKGKIPEVLTGAVEIEKTSSGKVGKFINGKVLIGEFDLDNDSDFNLTIETKVSVNPDGGFKILFGNGAYSLVFKDGVIGFNTTFKDIYGCSADIFRDGKEHHLIVKFSNYDVSNNEITIDGVKQKLKQITGKFSTKSAIINYANGKLYVGSFWSIKNGDERYTFTGTLGSTRLFKGTLTVSEGRNLYYASMVTKCRNVNFKRMVNFSGIDFNDTLRDYWPLTQDSLNVIGKVDGIDGELLRYTNDGLEFPKSNESIKRYVLLENLSHAEDFTISGTYKSYDNEGFRPILSWAVDGRCSYGNYILLVNYKGILKLSHTVNDRNISPGTGVQIPLNTTISYSLSFKKGKGLTMYVNGDEVFTDSNYDFNELPNTVHNAIMLGQEQDDIGVNKDKDQVTRGVLKHLLIHEKALNMDEAKHLSNVILRYGNSKIK